jgi:hypothetical protein
MILYFHLDIWGGDVEKFGEGHPPFHHKKALGTWDIYVYFWTRLMMYGGGNMRLSLSLSVSVRCAHHLRVCDDSLGERGEEGRALMMMMRSMSASYPM